MCAVRDIDDTRMLHLLLRLSGLRALRLWLLMKPLRVAQLIRAVLRNRITDLLNAPLLKRFRDRFLVYTLLPFLLLLLYRNIRDQVAVRQRPIDYIIQLLVYLLIVVKAQLHLARMYIDIEC